MHSWTDAWGRWEMYAGVDGGCMQGMDGRCREREDGCGRVGQMQGDPPTVHMNNYGSGQGMQIVSCSDPSHRTPSDPHPIPSHHSHYQCHSRSHTHTHSRPHSQSRSPIPLEELPLYLESKLNIDPMKSAKPGSVAPLKPLLTAYCPIFRFVRDAITQHNATHIVHQRQNNGRAAKLNNNREAQRAAME